MRSSYEISKDLEYLLEAGFDMDCVDENGEIQQDKVWDKLDHLVIERDEKFRQLGIWARDEKAFLEDMREQKAELDKRIKAKEAKLERIKAWIYQNMLMFGDRKLEYPNVVLRVGTSKAVEISDPDALPERYIRKKVSYEPMKTEIKKAIEGGERVPGAEIVEKTNLQVR